ncbi:MAG: C_GCAxxG_C_C family protein [Magnetococcales bacterium]|nr:C_GCAxxG_C_C family protein [Magnetococcales bacterium]
MLSTALPDASQTSPTRLKPLDPTMPITPATPTTDTSITDTPSASTRPGDEEIVRQVGALAHLYYEDGQFSCAEAIVRAFAEVFTPHRFDAGSVTRLATPFNGGFSELQLTCGMLTGGLLAIGMVTGRETPGDEESKEQTYTLTQIYHQRFVEELGTTSCKELLTRWKEQGTSKTLCKAHTQRMCERLAKLILQIGFHELGDASDS